jgi:hypothetical protein
VYEGTTFKVSRFRQWLAKAGIPWPLAQMRELKLAVGADGRARTLLSPFKSRTGRNQPSTTKYVFGPSTWLRGLIKPTIGSGIAYIDWEQQEFGIGAALSGDALMQEAYNTGDPYLAFAKQAGAVPQDATRKTHERELFKQCPPTQPRRYQDHANDDPCWRAGTYFVPGRVG